MKNIAVILSLLMGSFCGAQAQQYNWFANMGGSVSDEGRAVTTDAAGNLYIIGSFGALADFDPSDTGIYNLEITLGIGISAIDVFVCKLDASGKFLWAKQFASTDTAKARQDYGVGIATDAAGNVYTSGYFYGTVDFDPGTAVGDTFKLTGTGTSAFISKLNTNGDFVWARHFSASGTGVGAIQAHGLATDASGNSYLPFHFSQTVFINDTLSLEPLGGYDVAVIKLDAAGNVVQARQMGGASSEFVYDIDVLEGSFYITGTFSDTADFNPDSNNEFNLASAGADDVYIAKYDTAGNFIWAKAFGGTLAEKGNGVAVDAAGNVYVTGNFRNRADFNPGAGPGDTLYITANGGSGYDIFLIKLDSNEGLLWAKNAGSGLTSTSYQEVGQDIVTDAGGNVYVTGYFYGPADFNPDNGISDTTIKSRGSNSADLFIWKVNTSGNLLWAKQIGGTGIDYGYGITLDNWGNIIGVGRVGATTYFDADTAGAPYMTSAGSYDALVYQIRQENQPLPVTMSPLYGRLSPDGHALLEWVTYNEHNNKGFEIERSLDGKSFTYQDFVPGKAMEEVGEAKRSYTYTDPLPVHGQVFYRLHQVKLEGAGTYSNILRLAHFPVTAGMIEIFPNPADDVLYINSPVKVDIVLSGIDGRTLLRQPDARTLSVKEFAKGIYFISVSDKTGRLIKAGKIMKQ